MKSETTANDSYRHSPARPDALPVYPPPFGGDEERSRRGLAPGLVALVHQGAEAVQQTVLAQVMLHGRVRGRGGQGARQAGGLQLVEDFQHPRLEDRKSTRLQSSTSCAPRMTSAA